VDHRGENESQQDGNQNNCQLPLGEIAESHDGTAGDDDLWPIAFTDSRHRFRSPLVVSLLAVKAGLLAQMAIVAEVVSSWRHITRSGLVLSQRLRQTAGHGW